MDGSNRGKQGSPKKEGSNGDLLSDIHSVTLSERLPAGSSQRSVSASLLSLGINDKDDDPNNNNNNNNTTPSVSGNGVGFGFGRVGGVGGPTIPGNDGSVTTISMCDTESSIMGEKEKEKEKASSSSKIDIGGDLLSNSIHYVTNIPTLLNPFSTSQKN